MVDLGGWLPTLSANKIMCHRYRIYLKQRNKQKMQAKLSWTGMQTHRQPENAKLNKAVSGLESFHSQALK